MPSVAILGGFVALAWGADRFVEGAANTARNLGVSPLVIGLTIVGFGTSAPEMLVSGIAAASGSGGMSVGNAVGSNIANVALVLGVASFAAPLAISVRVFSRELPVLIVTMVLTYLLLFDRELSYVDGVALAAGLLVMLAWVVAYGFRERNAEVDATDGMPLRSSVSWLIFGLIVLLGSARVVVWGAENFASRLGVSDLVIGLTIVALGTSLPELAATVACAVKQQHDLAFGNIVGSNMFNLLGVLALPGLIAPGPIAPAVVERDYPVMFAVTLLLYLPWLRRRSERRLGRLMSAVLLLTFAAYVTVLFFPRLLP